MTDIIKSRLSSDLRLYSCCLLRNADGLLFPEVIIRPVTRAWALTEFITYINT